ncbi:MAG: hypothetical protein IPH48_17085 [bacterium]|nr:hypothetical protein [bacterium]
MSARLSRVIALTGVFAASLLLLTAGCSDEPAPLAPVTGACVVQGAISAPFTAGTEGSIYFQRVDGRNLGIEVLTDVAGRYRTEVPAGDYVITAYVAGLTVRARADGDVANIWVEPDTLRLEAGELPREIDFRLGVVALTGGNLAGLDGWSVRARLYPIREDGRFPYSMGSSSADIEDGRFRLEIGPAVSGTCRIQVTVQRDWSTQGETFWLPDVVDGDEGATYRVGADSLTVVTAAWPAPSRLTGTISGAWMDLGAYAPSMSAFNADSVIVAGPLRVDGFGHFVLPFLRQEPVRLLIAGSGSQAWIGGSDFDEATVFPLEAGVTVSGIDQAISTVLVRTTLEMYDPGVNSAQLELRDPTSHALVSSHYFNFNDFDGLTCMPPGQYLARITTTSSDRIWRNQWYDRATTPESATLITIPAGGGAMGLDIVLERGGVISGTVVNSHPGAAWGYVEVTGEDSETVLHSQYIGGLSPGGDFLLAGLEDGRYKVGLRFQWFTGGEQGEWIEVESWYPGTSDWATAGVIEISGADTVSGVVLPVP